MVNSKQICLAALCLALLLALSACGRPAQPTPAATFAPSPSPAAVVTPTETEPPTEETSRPDTIYVSRMEEFFAAIGSDRTVIVQPGAYGWANDEEVTAQGFVWESEPLYGNPSVLLAESDGAIGITIRDVQNLTIRGVSEGLANNLAEFSSANRFTDMLVFENCTDIVVEFLNLSRQWDEGTYGNNLVLYGCENVTLRGVRFAGGGNGGVVLNSCTGVLFDSCTFTGISAVPLFLSYRTKNADVNTCTFEYNESPQLDDGTVIRFRYNNFVGNLFEEGKGFGFDPDGLYVGTAFTGYPMETYDESYALEIAEAYVTGEDASFMVDGTDEHDGEQIYVVRAYNDMDTHIATLHWLYVGMETGRLWEWDIASDQVIEILF